jgi:hypothetical protein
MILFRNMIDKDGNIDYVNRYKNVRDCLIALWGLWFLQVFMFIYNIASGQRGDFTIIPVIITWIPAIIITWFLAMLVYQVAYVKVKREKEEAMQKCFDGI